MTLADKLSSSFRSLSRGFFDHCSSNSNLGFGIGRGEDPSLLQRAILQVEKQDGRGKRNWLERGRGGSRSVEAVDR